MATIRVIKGKNNAGDNVDVPFYIEIVQNGTIVLSCFSTESNANATNPDQVGITNNFDPALPTVINYYNLGKLTNTIAFNGFNLVNGQVFASGVNIGDGIKGSVSFGAITGTFSRNISVICNQLSATPSGVNYMATGTQVTGVYPSIGSVKSSDNTWVSALTPNTAKNPWYVASNGLTAPIVNKTTMINTDSLIVSGMLEGDVMHFFVNNVKQDNNTLVVDAGLQFIFSSMTGYEGIVHFNYTRAGVTSPNSEDVTVSANPSLLGFLTLQTVSGQVNYFVGEKVDVSNIDSGATLTIGKGSSAVIATLGTDYSIETITGGFRVTFLIAQIYKFWQTKPTFIDGGKTTVTVAQTRVILPKPIPSTLAKIVGESVTITNQATVGYDNINVLKNDVLIIASEGDYSIVAGNYTFLRVGSYTFVGQKSNVTDSEPSNAVIVSSLPTNLPTVNATGRFRFNNEESLDLFASGNINEPNSTGAGYRWLNNDENNIMIETVISYVDVLNPAGLSGIMAFEQGAAGVIPSNSKMIGLFLKNDNSIGVLVRNTNGLQPVNVKNVGSKSFPIKLRLEKIGTDFVFSYSLNVGVFNDTLTEIYRTPIGLNNYVLALAGSSGNTALQNTRFEQSACSWGVIGNIGSTN